MWEQIVDAPIGYKVSDSGSVRSSPVAQRLPCGQLRTYKERTLKQTCTPAGYPTVTIAGKTKYVHTLVAEAFLGIRPYGLHIAHNNGCKSDNRVSNLRYATPAENAADRAVHGTQPHGESHYMGKLTERAVRHIRQMIQQGITQAAIAEQFNVHPGTISEIKHNKIWKGVCAE